MYTMFNTILTYILRTSLINKKKKKKKKEIWIQYTLNLNR